MKSNKAFPSMSLPIVVVDRILQYTRVYALINHATYERKRNIIDGVHDDMCVALHFDDIDEIRVLNCQRLFISEMPYLPCHFLTALVIQQMSYFLIKTKTFGRNISRFDEGCKTILDIFENEGFPKTTALSHLKRMMTKYNSSSTRAP
jgi:hypothetical protein